MILVDSKINTYQRLGKISIIPFDPLSINPNSYDLKLSNSFQVARETICLPANVVGILNGKSSLARLGIEIHCTGGFVEAGFSGSITLEITNKHPSPIKLYSGMRIAQLVFVETERATIPYGNRPNSKYQHQTGATVSRYHLNKVQI